MRSAMALGMPAGPKMPFHEVMSKPGSVLPMAGTLGSSCDPLAAVTPSVRTRSVLSVPQAEPRSATYIWIWLPITSVNACGLDL